MYYRGVYLKLKEGGVHFHEIRRIIKLVWLDLVVFFAELDEDAQGGFGVQKCDIRLMSAGARLFIYQSDAIGFGFCEGCWEVFHGKGDMMDAFSSFLDSFGDGAFRGGGFQKFDARVSTGEKRHSHHLGWYLFNGFQLQSQLLVEFYAFFQVFDGDSDVTDVFYHVAALFTVVICQFKAEVHGFDIEIDKGRFHGFAQGLCQ